MVRLRKTMITSREKSIFLVGMICFQWANRPRSRADYNKIEVLNQIAVTRRGLVGIDEVLGVLLRWSRRGSETTPSFCSPFAHPVRKESMNPKVAHAIRFEMAKLREYTLPRFTISSARTLFKSSLRYQQKLWKNL